MDELDSAIEKVQWYSQRWKIETFHKVLKSGCRAEDVKLRTAQRLTNLIAVFCIIAWRVGLLPKTCSSGYESLTADEWPRTFYEEAKTTFPPSRLSRSCGMPMPC